MTPHARERTKVLLLAVTTLLLSSGLVLMLEHAYRS